MKNVNICEHQLQRGAVFPSQRVFFIDSRLLAAARVANHELFGIVALQRRKLPGAGGLPFCSAVRRRRTIKKTARTF
jgi:hypothetical protein